MTVGAFLRKKQIVLSPKLYFVDAMGSMAQGLFASLLIGTIFSTLGKFTGLQFFSMIAAYATKATGAVIGVAIAYALKAPLLVLLSAGVVGMAGNDIATAFLIDGAEKNLTGGPAGAFIAVVIAAELGKLVSKETKIDILVTPCVTLLSGVGIAALVGPGVGWVMYWLGSFLNYATEMQPVLMGIVISAVVGVILTLPISSAAICAMIGIGGIAGGAAAAGCCAQMVGFAVMSFRENRFGGLIAQGLGTSMLQMGNIVKNPRIWIPPTLASMITGPLASAVFGLRCEGVSAGMGTCGLVGPLGIRTATDRTPMMWVGLLLVCFVLPAILSEAFALLLRRIGWIRENDLKLDLS